MDVILLQRVEKLGQMGDIVTVRPGYARNFLIPQGKAARATADRIKAFEGQRAQLEAHNLKLRQEAQSVADKMTGLVLSMVRSAGETGLLYGSVRPSDVAQAVTDGGFTVSRSQVFIANPIKTLGIHTVHVVLHPEVKVPVLLNIALSQEEASSQLAAYQRSL